MKRPYADLRRSGGGEKYGLVFGLGCAVLLIVLLPLMIWDKGYFIYYGDFVSQQLPFYWHANEVIRSGGLFGWDWYTDLGSSFEGSYAFYLFGSPFFWLTTLLPQKAVLYAMPWLLCLKHGTAAVTAYAYIRRFVANKDAAVIGGLLYAYSGFQVFNIFFNHFQDVTALFPLLLIAMEELVNNERRGWFAVCVALMAIVNYFFFTGQAVFCLLYFLLRLRSSDFHITWKKFAALAIEAVIGVCIAAFVLLPAALAILENDRVDRMLFGQNMIFYTDKTRILRIIQSFFMIPDVPARPNLFSTDNGKWASIGGYLPLFSMAGVIAFMGKKRRHWATILTWICIVCAFIPWLNSAFYMFNASYYARWFYMPILIMAMMTAHALDDREIDWRGGIIACIAMLGAFGLISLLPEEEEGKVVFFQFANIPGYFYVVMAVCLVCWLGLFWLWCMRREGKPWQRMGILLTALACVACTMTTVYFGKYLGIDSKKYRDMAIGGRDHISVSYDTDEDDYFRIDIAKDYDNYPMFWGLSSMRCFQSVVTPSIMSFYSSIGIDRDVASRAAPEAYSLRGLLSVKYYYDLARDADDDSDPFEMPGFRYLRTENGFDLYVNDYFIPMGFPYDTYVTTETLDGRTDTTKERVMLRALVLDEEQAEKYADILSPLADSSLTVGQEQYLALCEQHRAEACHDFQYDSKGFSAKISLDAPKLVFFSVPYESGWTATVNGVPADIERVDNGLMAVRVDAGEDVPIVFSYEVPGLRYGGYATAAGAVLLVLYLLLARPLFRDPRPRFVHSYGYVPSDGVRASRAYMDSLRQHTVQETAPPAPADQKGEMSDGTSG